MPPADNGTPTHAVPQDSQTRAGSANRILAVGLEVSKRIAELTSLDDVYFFLVNDLRVLVDFDRCFVVTHLDGHSRFAAAGNQPILDPRSRLYEAVSELAPELKSLTKGLLISGTIDEADEAFKGLPSSLLRALADYVEVSEARFLFLVPLLHRDLPVAHLLLEFMGNAGPNDLQLLALLHALPVFASVLVEKWLFRENPAHAERLEERLKGVTRSRKRVKRYYPAALIVLVLLMLGLFYVPVEYTVGGELEIAPWEHNVAFCRMDGLIDKVSVREGAAVKKDQTLAVLDPTEIDYKIESSKRELELLSRQIGLLELESDKAPAKLGEAQNPQAQEAQDRKRPAIPPMAEAASAHYGPDRGNSAHQRRGEPRREEAQGRGTLLRDLNLQRPCSGSLCAGGPGSHDSRESGYVLVSEQLSATAHKLRVDMISPVTEAVPRLGNVCRVRGKFREVPPSVKVGMKGVGKIYVGDMSIWSILRQRLAVRWNRLSI